MRRINDIAGCIPLHPVTSHLLAAERAHKFVQAIEAMRRLRRKDGAVRWGLFRDVADPDRYLETFVVPSWAEHMRQHARATVDDQAIEAHAFSFLQEGLEPVAAHLIAVHAFDGRTPEDSDRTEISTDP